jgi:hypothetical protein
VVLRITGAIHVSTNERPPLRLTIRVRLELRQHVLYDLFFLLQPFAETASIGMVDLHSEPIQAMLQEFP